MTPATFEAYVDELEKIALSQQYVATKMMRAMAGVKGDPSRAVQSRLARFTGKAERWGKYRQKANPAAWKAADEAFDANPSAEFKNLVERVEKSDIAKWKKRGHPARRAEIEAREAAGERRPYRPRKGSEEYQNDLAVALGKGRRRDPEYHALQAPLRKARIEKAQAAKKAREAAPSSSSGGGGGSGWVRPALGAAGVAGVGGATYYAMKKNKQHRR